MKAMFANWNKSPDRVRVTYVLLLSLPVVLYHFGYLANASTAEKQEREAGGFGRHWRDIPARVQNWVSPVARPLAFGAMLFLILVNRGSPGDFIYFQF